MASGVCIHGGSHGDASDMRGFQREPAYLASTVRPSILHRCSDCNSWFTAKRALARHRRTQQHLKTVGLERSGGFPCQSCNQNFTRDYDRRRHEKRAHAYVSPGDRHNFQPNYLPGVEVPHAAEQKSSTSEELCRNENCEELMTLVRVLGESSDDKATNLLARLRLGEDIGSLVAEISLTLFHN